MINEKEYLKFLLENRIHPEYSLKDIRLEIEDRLKEVTEKINEEVKEQKKIRDFFILDPANVIAIVPIKENDTDYYDLDTLGEYKRFGEDIELTQINLKTFKSEVFKVGKSKYSTEYLEIARKTAKAFNGCTTPEFYKKFDKDFEEDNPILIKFGSLFFLLAPRVKSD